MAVRRRRPRARRSAPAARPAACRCLFPAAATRPPVAFPEPASATGPLAAATQPQPPALTSGFRAVTPLLAVADLRGLALGSPWSQLQRHPMRAGSAGTALGPHVDHPELHPGVRLGVGGHLYGELHLHRADLKPQ